MFCAVIVTPVHFGAFFNLEYWAINYANNSSLTDVVLSPGIRVAVAESLNSDLGKVGEWCDLWGWN